MDFIHIPVLFDETVASLDIKPDGVYVDCTGGGGTDSQAILDRLSPQGRLVVIDRDPDAIAHLTARFAGRGNVNVVHDNFSNITSILSNLGIEGADGILADLGISSYQVDEGSRGFSFHKDAPLDMRMSKEGMSAFDVVNGYGEKELGRIISLYGEEKFAYPIARAIVREREKKPVETTMELADIISAAVPAKYKREGNPCRKTFQALRLEVNGEITCLADAVSAMFEALRPGGVLSIISFHSLEDRTVKQAMAPYLVRCTCPPESPVCTCGGPRAKKAAKPVTATEEELERNPRARSARLRTIIKIR